MRKSKHFSFAKFSKLNALCRINMTSCKSDFSLRVLRIVLFAIVFTMNLTIAQDGPIRLHPEHPHCFEFRGDFMVLISWF